MTARLRCWWAKSIECVEMIKEVSSKAIKTCLQKQCKASNTILSETCCLKESKTEI